MIDIKIDPVTNNLVIENGDFVLVKDADEIAQSLRIRLRMALGNWFLDNRLGVDYFGIILKKGYSLSQIERELKRVIKETIGVTGITSYKQLVQDRKLTVNFTVSTVYDESINIKEEITI